MADNIETVSIIKIEIDRSIIDTSKKKVLELTGEIMKLKTAQSENEQKTKEQKLQYIETQAKIAAYSKELKQNNEVLKQANTVANMAKGSNEQLRASLSAQTSQYNKLSEVERNNIDIGGKLQKSIRGISDELKKNESAIGDNRRNVGNYKEAFSGLVGVVSKSTGPIGGAAAGFADFNTVMKANPILAIVSLLVPLIQKFFALDSVAEKVSGVMASVNAAFELIVGGVGNFIKAIASGEGIFSAFSSSFDGLGDKIKEAAKQTIILQKATEDLADRKREQIVLNAKDEAQIKNLIIQSKDRTKTEDERLRFLDKAARIERNLFEEKLSLAKEDEKIAQRTLALADKDAANIDELTEKARQATAARIQTESESADVQEKIINRRNALLDDEQQKIDKLAENEAKRLEKVAAAEEKLLEARKKMEADGDAFAQKESEKFQKLQDDKVKAVKDAETKRLADMATTFNEENAIIQQRADLLSTQAENEITDKKKLEEEKKKITLNSLSLQLEALQKFAQASGVITQQQALAIDKLKAQIKGIQNQLNTPTQKTSAEALGLTDKDLAAINDALKIVQRGVGDLQAAITAAYQVRINEIDNTATAEIEAVENSTLSEEQKAEKIDKINKKAALDKYEIEKEQFETNKALAVVQALINTALAVVSAITVAPPAGYVLAAISAAAGAAQIAAIESQPPPKRPSFKDGGIVKAQNGAVFGRFGGRSHAEGGNVYYGADGSVIETERDEIFAVINKRSSNMIKNLSALNQMGGGVPFERGGIVEKFASGGSIGTITNSAFQSAENTASLAAQLSGMVPVLVIEEFENVKGRKVRVAQNLEV